MMMVFAVPGLVLLVLSVAAMMFMLPRHGKVHPWATMPYLDSIIPLAIITGLVFGGAMVVVAFI